MKSKEYYIDLIQSRFWSYNKYWENPIENTELQNNTYETCNAIIANLKYLDSKRKQIEGKTYTEFPTHIQAIIQDTINLTCDGRDLRHKVLYIDKEYDHHVQENGYLYFENNPLVNLDVIHFCEDLKEIVESEEATADLSKYLNKIYEFEGYESGTYYCQIQKINYNKDKKQFTFDGNIIEFCTANTNRGDGILFYDVEDFKFNKLPYFDDEITTQKELADYLDNIKTLELLDCVNNSWNSVKWCFEHVFGITYK